jgi:hypothetical protein
MAGHRVHIFGASGSGTTTVGRALATALASQHFDSDDFYWFPSDPPFRIKRPIPDRVALMQEVFLPRRDWILSGSIDSWSEGIADRFTLAVFLEMETGLRLDRLRRREELRLRLADVTDGPEREEIEAFLQWAAGYDDGLLAGRNRMRHRTWSEQLDCPVITLGAHLPVPVIVDRIVARLDPPEETP